MGKELRETQDTTILESVGSDNLRKIIFLLIDRGELSAEETKELLNFFLENPNLETVQQQSQLRDLMIDVIKKTDFNTNSDPQIGAIIEGTADWVDRMSKINEERRKATEKFQGFIKSLIDENMEGETLMLTVDQLKELIELSNNLGNSPFYDNPEEMVVCVPLLDDQNNELEKKPKSKSYDVYILYPNGSSSKKILNIKYWIAPEGRLEPGYFKIYYSKDLEILKDKENFETATETLASLLER